MAQQSKRISSKAIEQTARAAQKALDVISDAGEFIGKIVGPPAEQLSGLLTDQIKFWRAKNLARIAAKYDDLAKSKALHPDAIKHLPFGVAVRVLEPASMEDDEEISELWAKLIFNATSPNSTLEIKKVYIDTLKSLSAVDAAILNLMWKLHTAPPEFLEPLTRNPERQPYMDALASEFETIENKFSYKHLNVAIQNLLRLRLIAVALYLDIPFELRFSGWSSSDMEDTLERQRSALSDLATEIASNFEAIVNSSSRGLFSGAKASEEIAKLNYNYSLTILGQEFMQACSL
jgi:hypothetical protein